MISADLQLEWYEAPAGLVALEGQDRHDLLHRLSSQDIVALKEGGRIAPALLTTHQGRLIDWLQVFESQQKLWLVGAPGRARRVADWLEQYIIMEDVEIGRVQDTACGLFVLGPPGGDAAAALSAACQILGLEAAPPEGSILPLQLEGQTAVVMRAHAALGGGLQIIPTDGSVLPWETLLARELGSARGALAWEVRRLMAGMPSPAYEYRQDAAPFELRIVSGAVHWHKGCYVGQEVLSRLEAYDKVMRLTMGVRSVKDGHLLASWADKARLRIDGKVIGKLSSAAVVPWEDKPTSNSGFVALAVVKREAALPQEAELLWPEEADGAGAARSTPVRLVHCPFWEKPSEL